MLVILPGPPSEMKPMFEEQVFPLVRARAGGAVLKTRVLKMASISESDVDQTVAPLYKTFTNPRTTILSAPGQVELHITAIGASPAEAEERLEVLGSGIRSLMTGRIFSEDGRELPVVVGSLLRERGLSLSVAESCTGGLLAARLTEVPGSSAYFERGFVTYSNRSKMELLNVPSELIESEGAVSQAVAAAMAAGARRSSGTDIGVGITGVAGPDGGAPEKPVGFVCIAIDGAAGTRVRQALFLGDRERVRHQSTQSALEMLRRGLLALPPL
jgi:nicotinamide-nucleotide amidase